MWLKIDGVAVALFGRFKAIKAGFDYTDTSKSL